MSFAIELIGKLDHTQLFFRIELLDFLDDLAGGQIKTLFQTRPQSIQHVGQRSLIQQFELLVGESTNLPGISNKA